VVLGTGDRKYEDCFRRTGSGVSRARGRENCLRQFAGGIRWRRAPIYSSCLRDTSPSGLNQMYSLSMVRCQCESHRRVGRQYRAVRPGTRDRDRVSSSRSIPVRLFCSRCGRRSTYMDEGGIWKRIQLNGMAKDFSWKTPAAEYAKLYEAARTARGLSPTRASSRTAASARGETARGAGQGTQAAGQAARNQSQLEHLTKANKGERSGPPTADTAAEDKEHGRQFNSVSNRWEFDTRFDG